MSSHESNLEQIEQEQTAKCDYMRGKTEPAQQCLLYLPIVFITVHSVQKEMFAYNGAVTVFSDDVIKTELIY